MEITNLLPGDCLQL